MPNNTTVNKVIINGVTRLDLTSDTATPSDVAQGKTFHDASGALCTGTASGGGGDSWSWMGKNPTLTATVVNKKVYLKDTDFSTWTPSTTAHTLESSANLTKQTVNASSYDYVTRYKFHAHFDYNEGTTGKAMITDQYASFCVLLNGYYTNLAQITGDNPASTNSSILYQSSIDGGVFYKNSSGNDTYANNASYGIYMGTMSPTGSYYTPTGITPQKPAISIKCSGSYLSTTNCALVNPNTSYYELKIEIWRVDLHTTPRGGGIQALRDMWVNGF